MKVLSIQSAVAFGHVGNSAAVFPMQRLGVEVWPVNTVQLSNHTGYPEWTGQRFAAADIADLLSGVAARGAWAQCDGVLSGYVGDPDLARVIAETVEAVRAARPRAVYCCDPVMGNATAGLFVEETVAEVIAEQLVGRADIVTPNAFELARLTGLEVTDVASARTAADALAARGPQTVICTSIPTANGIAVLGRNGDGAWLVETPRIKVAANGAGDAFTGMLFARLLAGSALERALGAAVSAIYATLEATRIRGGQELELIAAQDLINKPPRLYTARALRD